MTTLEPPNNHFLDAATGWLMLGNAEEARLEFAQIAPGLRAHPLVLDLEWRLLAHEQRWLEAAATGEMLVRVCPEELNAWIHRSYALHELRRTQEAHDQLLPALESFPKDATVPYNLGCYACQLGDLVAARRWLKRSLTLRGSGEGKMEGLRSALEDPDMQPLWPELRKQLEKMERE